MQKISKKYGAIRFQTVRKSVGGWKWATTRGYYRIIRSPYMAPAEINIVRPGEEIVWSSQQVTFDYAGGNWGCGESYENGKEIFKKTYFKDGRIK